MASWKNNYEYLAEVIAHRRRQGGRSEYKLRYVWDRVIEWTPASRLRKATQFEIDYVLKFCREHNNGVTKRPANIQRPPAVNNSDVATLSSRKDTDTIKEVSSPATRSQSRRTDPPNRDFRMSTETVSGDEPPNHGSSATSEPKTTTPPSLFDKVEHDDMLYDRSVAQFHEACRKRRELKRQAIEAEKTQEKIEPSTPVRGSVNGGKRSHPALSPECHSLKPIKLASSPDVVEKPSKVPRLSDTKNVKLVNSKPSSNSKKAESPLLAVD
ncbi:unnamed protein product [Echinostoma caproni]|uniref:Chromo domain-containing protein n=1 Tax=Echinostoma caproni TaxID=27848 RepID=A0A183B3W4_9TREM|nr:unnamed protein product [Echinostoma caproni]